MLMRPGRRVGRGGLLGAAARTAVVAGTATAVSGSVQRRQAAKAQEAAQADAWEQQQQQAAMDAAAARAVAAQAPTAPAPAAPAAPAGDDLVAKLSELAQLKSQGILSDDEFAAAKAKLLG